MNNIKFLKNKGYIALITVLILGAVSLAIAVSLLLLGTGSALTSYTQEQSAQARSLADACSFEALNRIAMDNNFAGTRNLSLGYGTCSFTVTNLGGANRQINATGTVGIIVRKNKITTNALTPQVTVNYWQEVADF